MFWAVRPGGRGVEWLYIGGFLFMKVFCISCRYYFRSVYFPGKEGCLAFDNLEDTYRSAKSRGKEVPSVINKDNNCVWYELKVEEDRARWWKIW